MEPHNSSVSLEKIVALCKRRGFVYQSSEIYGGLNGVYDFGYLGTLLKQNIRKAWLNSVYQSKDPILLLEGSILGPAAVWNASGHLQNFHDPMIDCLNCKHRYRTDDINVEKPCPHCGQKRWTDVRQFNMMFKTQLGAASDQSSEAYLRPETAQAIYINFKNILSTNRVKIPFGIAQTGKAFRNEITPKQFLFRMREFEQMEMEWFCKPDHALQDFQFWCTERVQFYKDIGIRSENIRIRPHERDELSHYSQCTSDVEYHFPFGWKELEGIAYRGDFDLRQHSTHSGKDLSVYDEETKETYIPHVVETSVGVDRLFLTILFDAYHEDIVDHEQRITLRLHPSIAPIKAAFMPLTKQQTDAMYAIFQDLKKRTGLMIQFDESGSIGKRYRRQDEIGTPLCFTYDFESTTDAMVTIRHRDTMQQDRVPISDIASIIQTTIHNQ